MRRAKYSKGTQGLQLVTNHINTKYIKPYMTWNNMDILNYYIFKWKRYRTLFCPATTTCKTLVGIYVPLCMLVWRWGVVSGAILRKEKAIVPLSNKHVVTGAVLSKDIQIVNVNSKNVPLCWFWSFRNTSTGCLWAGQTVCGNTPMHKIIRYDRTRGLRFIFFHVSNRAE